MKFLVLLATLATLQAVTALPFFKSVQKTPTVDSDVPDTTTTTTLTPRAMLVRRRVIEMNRNRLSPEEINEMCVEDPDPWLCIKLWSNQG